VRNLEHICLIGTGKLSRHLAKKLSIFKDKPLFIWGRNSEQAASIASEFGLVHLNNIQEIPENSGVLLCVSDHAIEQLANELKDKSPFLIHFSGTQSISRLTPFTPNAAIIWPNQSFSNAVHIDWKNVPLILEVSNETSKVWLMEIVNALGGSAVFLDEESRKKLHLAAVVANNFINHLFVLTETWCIQNKLDFKLLLPLINQSTQNLQNQSPSQLQTGPASRNDWTTIHSHIEMLSHFPELKQVYTLFSDQLSLKNKN
jgi:predicted short-subunit dehydrogenase-like oxidoreductase (DUF2520 family)